ncbi:MULTISPECIES: nucleotidyl transferase AbiEii/AbiGii toxin family protein [unclassified Nostoc]|uniref:nucleotidyl transferase AbiEii/AbiGii toxin family protein n=1 Tax=unclassified Nostoc TaxID=2593658 RepID=UPI001F557EA6|nr:MULTISPECIES: nucleotidyl transferase AbiEii/AbiGii toxin family protein [unclassified Nostoc]
MKSLNLEVLKEGSAYFGGGTLLALDFEEYRWSKDIDFISPVGTSGYKYLRTVVFDGGYEALFSDLNSIQIRRGTTDQYGIRMMVMVDNLPIKTEIIAESRFHPDPPRYTEWSPVPCLSLIDCFTSKLLANSDRYMDDSVEARDLIDLAILRLQSPIPQAAIDKAEKAYEVIRPLKTVVKRFQERPDYREKCFLSLQIDETQIPKIIDGVDLIATDLNLEMTQRVFKEQHDIFSDLDRQE